MIFEYYLWIYRNRAVLGQNAIFILKIQFDLSLIVLPHRRCWNNFKTCNLFGSYCFNPIYRTLLSKVPMSLSSTAPAVS